MAKNERKGSPVSSLDAHRAGQSVRDQIGPFTIVPEWIVDEAISTGAIALYVVLALHANKENKAWPSRKALADRLQVSKDTIDRWKRELVSVGALEVQNRKTEGGNNRSNLYRIMRVPPQG